MKPRKYVIQGKNHGELRGKVSGQHHSTSSPCFRIIQTPLQHRTRTQDSFLQPCKKFTQIDYLGLRLDPMLTMKPAVASIQEKANKGHSLALAVSYSLWYDKHHSNPTLCQSPVEMLNLWKSCVLPHFLIYLRYISAVSQLQALRSASNDLLTHPTSLRPSHLHLLTCGGRHSSSVHYAEPPTCTTKI